MNFIRRYIVRVVVEEINRNGIIIGSKRIYNKDGELAIAEVTDGK